MDRLSVRRDRSPGDTELSFISYDLSKFLVVQLEEVGRSLKVSRPRALFDLSNRVLDVSTVDHQRFLVELLEDASTELVPVRVWAEEITAEFDEH